MRRRGKFTDAHEAEVIAEHVAEGGRRPTEGDPTDDQISIACSEARRIADLCELLGFEFRGARPLVAQLEAARRAGVSLAAMIEDPNERPYVWDLDPPRES